MVRTGRQATLIASEGTAMTTPTPSVKRRREHDAPDTTVGFERLAAMPAGPERDRLRADVISAWLPVVHRISRRFRSSGESAADLRQVAALALVKAADRYDPYRGPFEAFAIPTVTGELKRHIRDHAWAVHIPRRIQELRAQVRFAQDRLQQTGRHEPPSAGELAAETGLRENEVLLGLQAEGVHQTLALDRPLGGSDDLLLADVIGGPDDALERVVDRESLKPLLAALPEQEKRVLYWRFFESLSQQQIGTLLGVSQMQVCRILQRTFTRLRQDLCVPAAA
jgi:RNA polymerase sigma-B factor